MYKINRRGWIVSVMDKYLFKIVKLEKHVVNILLFLIVIIHLPLLEAADECPLDFHLAPSTGTEKYCYSLKKDPEKFSDKFVSCDGNLFTHEMYINLKLPKPDGRSLWTDYKSMYPGGLFVDWSYTSSMGLKLNDTDKINRETDVSVGDELCVVIDPVKNFSMARCDALNYRYCVVEAGPDTRKFKHVKLTVMIDSGEIQLNVDQNLDENKIKCFTNSSGYYPQPISLEVVSIGTSSVYRLLPNENGYYWCTHTDTKNFYISESNKALYVEDLSVVLDVYAVKLTSAEPYLLNDASDASVNKLMDGTWLNNLREYVYFTNEYSKLNEGAYNYTDVLNFKKNHLYLDYKGRDTIVGKEIKRLYLDGMTALLHVELDPEMKPVKPGQWDKISIEYMKPVYYCDKEKEFSLGMNRSEVVCKLDICDGNFDEGVEIITIDDCSTTTEFPTTPTDDTKLETSLDVVINDMMKLYNSTEPIMMNDEFHDVFTKSGDLGLALAITKMKEFLNSTDPIMMQDIQKVFNQVDKVLISEGLHIKSNFLHLLDNIAARIDLNGSFDSCTVGKNVAMLVADAQPHAPVKGLRVATRDTDTFTNNTFAIMREINRTLQSSAESEMVVSLPDSVSSSKRRRVSFVVFRNNHAFQGGQKHYSVNSRVLSVNVENITKFPSEEGIEILMKPLNKPKRNQNRTCAFWQFNKDNTGSWSQKGCTFIGASQPGLLDKCSCNHLTHFAEILIRTGFPEEIETTLESISVIGCCISILGLSLVGLTAALFRSWRRDYSNKIWLQLCISILILSICFLVVVFAQFQENNILCLLTGVVLHYSVLSSFCWMLVAAVISYRKLVLVFNRDVSHKLLRASAFAWGTPCAVVGILVSIAPHSYAGQYEGKSPSGAFCYPSGLALWLAVYAPITLILLANWTLFVLIVRSVFGTRRPSHNDRNDTKEAFRCVSVSCLLVFLFGLPWFFGLFAFNVICVFLFTILATFQGFVLFIFIVCNKKTRDLWLVKLKIKQPRVPFTSTTDTNRIKEVNVPLSSIDGARHPLPKNRTQPGLLTNRGT